MGCRPFIVLIVLTVLGVTAIWTAFAADDTASATPPAASAPAKAASVSGEVKADSASHQAKPDGGYDELTLGLGGEHIGLSGDERRFDQYVTPPHGTYVPLAQWEKWDPGARLQLDLNLRDLGAPGPSGDLWGTAGGGVVFEGRFRRSEYYFDTDPGTGRSRRRDGLLAVRSSTDPNRPWDWSLAASGVDLLGQPVDGPVDWQQRNVAAQAGYRTDDYTASAHFRRESFRIRTGTQFSGESNEWGMSLASRASGPVALQLDLARTSTDLDGLTTGFKTSEANMAVDVPVSDALSLSAVLHHHEIEQTPTQNAYARANSSARLEADYQFARMATLQGFWETGVVEYVDGRQLTVVNASQDTLGARLRARLAPGLKLDALYRRKDNHDRPLRYDIAGNLADTVVYSTTKHTNASLSYAPPRFSGGLSVQWERDQWANDVQMVQGALDTRSVTGWWQPHGDKWMMTASFSRQTFDLPLDASLVFGGPYTSKTDSFVLGVNYQPTPRRNLYANVTRVSSDGASVNDYKALELGFDFRLTPRDVVTGSMTFGSFEDWIDNTRNFDATIARVSWRRQF